MSRRPLSRADRILSNATNVNLQREAAELIAKSAIDDAKLSARRNLFGSMGPGCNIQLTSTPLKRRKTGAVILPPLSPIMHQTDTWKMATKTMRGPEGKQEKTTIESGKGNLAWITGGMPSNVPFTGRERLYEPQRNQEVTTLHSSKGNLAMITGDMASGLRTSTDKEALHDQHNNQQVTTTECSEGNLAMKTGDMSSGLPFTERATPYERQNNEEITTLESSECTPELNTCYMQSVLPVAGKETLHEQRNNPEATSLESSEGNLAMKTGDMSSGLGLPLTDQKTLYEQQNNKEVTTHEGGGGNLAIIGCDRSSLSPFTEKETLHEQQNNQEITEPECSEGHLAIITGDMPSVLPVTEKEKLHEQRNNPEVTTTESSEGNLAMNTTDLPPLLVVIDNDTPYEQQNNEDVATQEGSEGIFVLTTGDMPSVLPVTEKEKLHEQRNNPEVTTTESSEGNLPMNTDLPPLLVVTDNDTPYEQQNNEDVATQEGSEGIFVLITGDMPSVLPVTEKEKLHEQQNNQEVTTLDNSEGNLAIINGDKPPVLPVTKTEILHEQQKNKGIRTSEIGADLLALSTCEMYEMPTNVSSAEIIVDQVSIDGEPVSAFSEIFQRDFQSEAEVADEESSNTVLIESVDEAITVSSSGLTGVDNSVVTSVMRSRKRSRNPSSWSRNKLKRMRQSGEAYKSSAGKENRARTVTMVQCNHGKRLKSYYKCCELKALQKEIHDSFWSLSDVDKDHFYGRTTERRQVVRPRKSSVKSRKFAFFYYLFKGSEKLQVCRTFYTKTLDIDIGRVHYYHQKKIDQERGCPLPARWGKHVKREVSESAVQAVINHINSFARRESHYCRASSSREYLDASLNVSLMYDLFCTQFEDGAPVKLHKYREIFMTKFNIGFAVPRKDRCDKCEEQQKSVQPWTNEDTVKFESHYRCKNETKAERDRDREIADHKHAVICFDLQNVISLPNANVKTYFYLRKLSVYNMTAHCSIDKTGYCAIWPENLGGRSGNDIASAVVQLLEQVAEKHDQITQMTLWSDACVPQNKNRVMSLALLKFLSLHPRIELIIQKFGTPGHSSVQEVDNLHSQIEKKLRAMEVYSPVSLVRVLKHVNRTKPFTILQMRKFHDYHAAARYMAFDQVPFTRVKQITYRQNDLHTVEYCTTFMSHGNASLHTARVCSALPNCRTVNVKPAVNQDKLKDIKKMMEGCTMPETDKTYYLSVFSCSQQQLPINRGVQKGTKKHTTRQSQTKLENTAINVIGLRAKHNRQMSKGVQVLSKQSSTQLVHDSTPLTLVATTRRRAPLCGKTVKLPVTKKRR